MHAPGQGCPDRADALAKLILGTFTFDLLELTHQLGRLVLIILIVLVALRPIIVDIVGVLVGVVVPRG